MKAIVFTSYGSPENMHLADVEKPVPKDDEILVKVAATAVNDFDWSMVRGKPILYRLMFGIFKPKHQIPGMEVAGIVESFGSAVTNFKLGDAVFGDTSEHGFGTFAEYVCVNEKALIIKPEEMSFVDAASLPHASLLAWQAFEYFEELKSGQNVLINGAGGGVGTFALQLAKQRNCTVTGVDTGKKLETMKVLGFDTVLDYKKQDFTKNEERYDFILDCKSNRSPFSYARSLKVGGTYVTVGGKLYRLFQLFLLRGFISWIFRKNLRILALKPNRGLEAIATLYSEGKLKCLIDGPYPLSEAPQRIQYFGEGKHTGKVILRPGM